MTAADQHARIIAGRYRVLRTLGAGAHGTVDLAEDLLNGGRRVAVKRLEAIVGAGDPEPAAEVLRWMLHPSWAEVLDEGRLDEHGRFQVTRYVPGHSLDHVELPRPADEVMRFLEDGARVLRALHRRGLFHYDVTPGNWLREESPEGPRFTLTDGGLASMGPVRGIARGTPAFMAPEILEGAPHDHRADLYSLGLVAWRLATGADPHGTGGAGEVLGRRRRVAAPPLRKVRPDAPAGLERILAALLERDPERRVADGEALLALLAESGWTRAQDDLLPDESVAAAVGGGLVGRADALARFRAACQAMSSEVVPAAADGTAGPRRTAAVDTVLIVHGPSGSGATRLLRELASVARSDGLATLALSARDGTADRRSVLRRIADGLGAVLGETPTLGSTREGREAEDSPTSSEARATERFVDLCERAAARTPVVLLIEDFAELAPAAQEGLRVLSRHLIARVEHPDGRRPLRFLLVVDHGPDDPSAMLIPDAADPRRPLLALPSLTPADIGALVADRLPGMELPAPDLEALHQASEGLPRTLTSLLAEGLRRRDVRRVDSRWIWMVDDLRAYRPSQTIPPAVQRALDALPASARDALTRLALLDDAAPEPVALALADESTLVALVGTRLLARSHVGDDVRYAPVSRALRDLLRVQDPAGLHGHRAALLAAMGRRPQLDLIPDEARLLAETGDVSGALARLSAAEASRMPGARVRAAAIAADLCATTPGLLADAGRRLDATTLLVQGPVGTRISDAITAALPSPATEADDEVRLRLAEDAFERALYARAISLLTPPLASQAPLWAARRSVALLRSRVALDARSVTRKEAAELAQLAHHASSSSRPLRVQLRLALSRLHYEQSSPQRARATALAALRECVGARQPLVLAQALNVAAICHQRCGEPQLAEVNLSRSVRIYRALGEVGLMRRSLHNLARLQMKRSAFFDAAQSLATALALSSRYADQESACIVLLTMSGLYDAHGNPSLAMQSARRAVLRAEAGRLSRLSLDAQCVVAQLATSLGSIPDFHSSIRRARDAAAHLRDLRSATPIRNAILHHRLCLGQLDKAVTTASRYERHGENLSGALAITLNFAISLRESERRRFGGRHAPHAFRRTLGRVIRIARRIPLSTEPRQLSTVLGQLLSQEFGVSGLENRLVIVALLAFGARPSNQHKAFRELLGAVSRNQTQRRHLILLGRVEALRAIVSYRQNDPAGAQASIERALLLRRPSGDGEDASHPEASEFGAPSPEYRSLSQELQTRFAPASRRELRSDFWSQLHSLAYRASTASDARASTEGRVARTLRQILSHASRLQAGTGLEALLDSLNEGAREITGAERACVVLIGPDSGREVKVVSTSTGFAESGDRPKVSETIIRRVLSTREPLLVHDVFEDSELMSKPSVASLSLRSVLCVPLVRGDRFFGAMYADSSTGAGSFDRTDLEILSLFAEQAAGSIEAARLLADIQRSYTELRSTQERLVRGERLRVMGELASGVAHEFNNLLTAILARIQLLALEPLPVAFQREIGMIQKAALDAAEVVRRLQSFSRNQRQTDFQRLEIGEICADVVEFLRPLWTGRRLSGRPQVSVHLRTTRGQVVLGDPTELREVVTNLLKNALEALEGGGTIVIETQARADLVLLTVQDDGAGITAEARSKIFTPFFTTKGERGTGLGLCLAQQIVERHGGEIHLDPTQPRGTRASVTLPLAPVSRAQAPASSASKQSEAPAISVVVVDDDANVLDPLCAFLRRSGFQVRSAMSADDAIRMVRQSCPDVVISDIGMPGRDGLELRRLLAAEAPNLPVVLMTGRTSRPETTGVTPTQDGPIVIAKPFTMRQVLEIIARVTSDRRCDR